LCLEVPRSPSHAVHGPATGRQHAPPLRQSRSKPCVEDRRGAATVISWRAEPVDASWFARLGGQDAAVPREPAAEAASASGRQAQTAIHLIACRLRA
jgi:hypothetical protein